MTALIVTLAVVVAIFGAVVALVLTRFLYICQPNEVLIFSGGQRASSSSAVAGAGRKVGYRIIKGGRAVRIPLLETVDSMDLTNMPIEVGVQGAYSKGGIPVNVHGIANVKIAGEPPVLDNAIERLLGVPRPQIMQMAKDTLEGNLRGVLATLTPEELNQDKIKFAQSLLAEAEDDLRRLGLELDTLKIQDVSDDVNYLDSIGRRQSAEVQKKAMIAEARAKAESQIQAAANRQQTELSKIDAAISTLRARNASRVADAQTRSAALVAEAQGQVASQLASAEGALEVQKARVEQVRRQLAADVLEPARARKAAAEAQAKGDAAQIVEQGRATAVSMGEIANTWREVGASARNVFLMQKVADLARIVMGTVHTLKVEKLTVLGGIGGGVGPNGTGAPDLTGRLIAASEQIKAATGVDLAAALRTRVTPPQT
ncbi:MAG TPA: SPFH domain-containing protein [Polyangia bacterium]|nr:SPFH domain-containing protein [Polyangia bacterium]